MKAYIVNKKIGETPLEALRGFVKKSRLSSRGKYTYAGRLDPMAEGVLLVLADVNQKQKEKYLSLPKLYEAEVLFGLNSDSGDLLGLPKKGRGVRVDAQDLLSAAKKLVPSATLPLPKFSSVIVKGKPAFSHARAGKKVTMPTRKMEIKSIAVGRIKTVTADDILERAIIRVNKVNGDFRQELIISAWKKLLGKSEKRFQTVKLTIYCGSGTYVRSIAEHLGETLGTSALLYGLKRTAVGKYVV